MRSFEKSGKPETEPGKMKKLVRSPIARAAVVAAALHAPLVPGVGDTFFGKPREATHEDVVQQIIYRWLKKGAMLHPQSEDEQANVTQKKQTRESRIDTKEVQNAKRDMRERIERGEHVKFRDLYFKLERVNGVDPDLVGKAEKIADSLIVKYAHVAHGELSEPLIRRMVTELYGPSEAYDWGQASVSEYFVNGSRNCVAIAKAELIVFEGVVDSLPETLKQRYRLSLRKVKQHQIAMLGEREQTAGPIQKTFLLEPPVTIERPNADKSGTADIDLGLLMKGMVSDRPIQVDAAEAKPEKPIPDSPDIDFVTDQPVSDGIEVQGKLRGSEFVRRVAIQKGIVPRLSTEKEPIEFDLIPLDLGKEVFQKRWQMTRAFGVLDLRDFVLPAAETLAKSKDTGPWPIDVYLPDISAWSEEAIEAALDIGASELHIQTDQEGHLPPGALGALESRKGKSPGPMGFNSFAFQSLHIQTPEYQTPEGEPQPGIKPDKFIHIPIDEFKRMLNGIGLSPFGKHKVITLPYEFLNMEEAQAIAESQIKKVCLPNAYELYMKNRQAFGELDDANVLILLKDTSLRSFLEISNFLPDFKHMNEKELMAAATQLDDLRKIVHGAAGPNPSLDWRKDDIDAAFTAGVHLLELTRQRKQGKNVSSSGVWANYIISFQKKLSERAIVTGGEVTE